MKKFLIIAGMIMCFILSGCSVGVADAKESNSNDDEYILKYADTGEDFTSMEVLIDKTTQAKCNYYHNYYYYYYYYTIRG